MKFGEAYRLVRCQYQLNQSRLAERANVHDSQLSAFASGKKNLTTNTLEKLLAAMPEEPRLKLLELVGKSTDSD